MIGLSKSGVYTAHPRFGKRTHVFKDVWFQGGKTLYIHQDHQETLPETSVNLRDP